MALRAPIPPAHRAIVLVFRFDTRDPIEKAAARYLARAPSGRMRARARDLILDGFRQHLQEQGVPPMNELAAKPRRSSIVIDGIYFDAHDPLHVQCAAFLKRSAYGARRDKALRLLIAGFQLQHSRQLQQPQQGTDQ
jgi:hypothetical protein